MKIIITHNADEKNYGQYEKVSTEIITSEGSATVSFAGGEPEDMTISRDLCDAWDISDLLVMAYNAGKNNEELEIEQIEE